MARTLTARLHQTDGDRGVRLFEVFDHRFLRVRITDARRVVHDYAMDIAILSPEARLTKYSNRRWLWAAWAAALSLLIDVALLFAGMGNILTVLPLAFGLASLNSLSVTMFLRSRRQYMVFHSRFADIPVVELLLDLPDHDHYAAFITGLRADIESRGREEELSKSDLRAGELRSLRRLVEQEVVPAPDYELAKGYLLALTT